MAYTNLISDQMAVKAAFAIKMGERKLEHVGSAMKQKVRPYLEMRVERLKLKIEIIDRVRKEVPKYLRRFHEEPGRLGFGPATPECYLEAYMKIPVVTAGRTRA